MPLYSYMVEQKDFSNNNGEMPSNLNDEFMSFKLRWEQIIVKTHQITN